MPGLEGKGGVYCLDADIARLVPAITVQGVTQTLEGVVSWAADPALSERLWLLSEEMTGVELSYEPLVLE